MTNLEDKIFDQGYNQVAIMCFRDGEHFWFHLRKNEFIEVFGDYGI